MRKSLTVNNSQGPATGLATVSRPSTSMAGRGRGGALLLFVIISYMGSPSQNFSQNPAHYCGVRGDFVVPGLHGSPGLLSRAVGSCTPEVAARRLTYVIS
jgi:hypothetical protein